MKVRVATSATISDEMVDFLLQNSPSAQVDMIDFWTRVKLCNLLQKKVRFSL